MITLTKFEQTRDALIAEILPIFKAHARIDNTDEDTTLLPRYIGGAIGAAENYLMRDIFPTVREWTGGTDCGGTWSVRRGRAKVITVQNGGVDVDPAGYTVVTSADPKTWGFEITSVSALNGAVVHAEFGFSTFAEMPSDLQDFILQAAGALYEVRELANYGAGAAGVATAEFLPLYLLDTWANLTYA
jgi:hypothetical protein